MEYYSTLIEEFNCKRYYSIQKRLLHVFAIDKHGAKFRPKTVTITNSRAQCWVKSGSGGGPQLSLCPVSTGHSPPSGPAVDRGQRSH